MHEGCFTKTPDDDANTYCMFTEPQPQSCAGSKERNGVDA